LVDLGAQHSIVADEVAAGFARVFAKTSFILGEEVPRFEADFAAFSGVPHCVAVANGTDAIELLLRAMDIGSGDEVILPVNTFVATAVAVQRAGATPVFVDIDPEYHLIDARRVAEAITTRTKALLPVHLYGQLAPMEELRALALRAKLLLLEDAAQAHGARRRDRGVGQDSSGATSSFYPGKNLGAYGDGGAVLTTSAETAARLRALRNYGSEQKYEHPILGFNSRLDTLQAVVLLAKLKHLHEWNEQRRRAAQRYDELLCGVDEVRAPRQDPANEHVWHLYVVRVPRRDQVLTHLHQAAIGAGIHYPVPLHLQGAFAHLGYERGAFPVAEATAGEILSLPIYPQISADQQQYVVDQLRAALKAG